MQFSASIRSHIRSAYYLFRPVCYLYFCRACFAPYIALTTCEWYLLKQTLNKLELMKYPYKLLIVIYFMILGVLLETKIEVQVHSFNFVP